MEATYMFIDSNGDQPSLDYSSFKHNLGSDDEEKWFALQGC
jgi:hypothetical protein